MKTKKNKGALGAMESLLQDRVAELEKKFNAASEVAAALRKMPRQHTPEEIRQILELQRGLIPKDAKQHDVNFVQTIGEVTPLCWIPVPDIQAVVKMLLDHLPDSTCRLKRAQFQSVISSLNEYVGEALDRNAQKSSIYATFTDCAKTGRVK